MALSTIASRNHASRAPTQGELVDLAQLCNKLEDMLLREEGVISAMRERGEDTSSQEQVWIRVLRRYERVCDLLTMEVDARHASAA
jgi:hypothetical protein